MSTIKANVWKNTAGVTYGTVLQVQHGMKTDTFTTTITSPVAVPNLLVNIAPRFASSRILITASIAMGMGTATAYLMAGYILRNGTAFALPDVDGSRGRWHFGTQGTNSTDATVFFTPTISDFPNTTGILTYQVYVQAEAPQTIWINRGGEADGNAAISQRLVSTITAMEIAV